MPIFLDSHLGSDVPVESIRFFLRSARAATNDGLSVRPLDLYCGDDGRVFYVVAAPDEATVRQYHAEQGVVCGRVRRVEPPYPASSDELTDANKQLVRQMIVAEQTSGAVVAPQRRLRQVG
jgi:hypothetical protein